MTRVSVHKVKPTPSATGSAPSWFAATQRFGLIQRRSDGQSPSVTVPPIVHEVLRSPGQPLDAATRAYMEPRFGHDFSKVRVHADGKAAAAASSIGARAFTSNRNIAFSAGAYAPQTDLGRRLVAHELTHVVQQGAGVNLKGSLSEAGDYYEQQADKAAESVARDERIPQHLALATNGFVYTSPRVQRKEATEARESPETMLDSGGEDQDKGCGFNLSIDGVTYCFNALEDTRRPGTYSLGAGALKADDGPEKKAKNKKKKDTVPIVYLARITVTIKNNKRSIRPAGEIVMTGTDAEGQTYQISVNSLQLAAAWDKYAPVVLQETGEADWDFVILEVHDEKNRETLPLHLVFWMGGEWGGKPPAKPSNRIASYRVTRKEVEDHYPNYVALRRHATSELLSQKQVSNIIMGKTAKQESDKGFDTSTYVGMHVRQDLVDIDDPKASSGVSKVPFDEAGGKYHGGTQWVSDIANPPNEILVNFITNQSAIPGGLTSSSVASFNDKIRLVLLYLKEVPSVVIKIRAYTDAAGSPKGNDELSKKRAQSAKEYLIDKNIWTGKEKTPAAVEPGRIILVEGKGQEEAEKALKQKYPSDWEKRIGTEKAADEKSRRLEIEYIAR